MIIGNGDIAGVLPERDDLLFFASGVSNSQEIRESEYLREGELLMSFAKVKKGEYKKHIVYFSSLAIFYSNTRYTKHKKNMEQLVRLNFPKHTIIRVGNIAWGTNPNTLINHFKAMVQSGEPLDIQDTTRYVVEKDEFLHWIGLIPGWPCEMNIPGKMMTVQEIVDKYVKPHA